MMIELPHFHLCSGPFAKGKTFLCASITGRTYTRASLAAMTAAGSAATASIIAIGIATAIGAGATAMGTATAIGGAIATGTAIGANRQPCQIIRLRKNERALEGPVLTRSVFLLRPIACRPRSPT